MDNHSTIIALILSLFIFIGCGVCKHNPTTHIRDSVVVNVVDSTVIRDSVRVIPIERYVNITMPNQESALETTIAKSKAYTDSLGFLHHTLENKQDIIYKYIEVEKWKTRDSLIYVEKEVPVEVEVRYVPKIYKFTMWFSIAMLFTILVCLYLKFEKKLRLFLK